MIAPRQTFYDAIGGEPTFRRILARFFAQLPEDEVLRAVYPPDDLPGAEARLGLFLVRFCGGPTAYSDERRHPRLRMRHAPFPISLRERDAWRRRCASPSTRRASPSPVSA